jgi:uncharacterized protein (UPF0147 family)
MELTMSSSVKILMENDDIYALIEETANMLRGMTLDPAIPQHAKSAMWEQIQTLEKALEKLAGEIET